MDRDTGSQDVYLSTTEGDDVIGGGDAVIDGGMKSSMRGGGTFPLKMRQACWWRRRRLDTTSLEDESSWKLGAAAVPKILIRPLLVLDHVGEGFGDCSPDCQCMQAVGMERLQRQREETKTLAQLDTFWNGR
jgi:hypothetical protein